MELLLYLCDKYDMIGISTWRSKEYRCDRFVYVL